MEPEARFHVPSNVDCIPLVVNLKSQRSQTIATPNFAAVDSIL